MLLNICTINKLKILNPIKLKYTSMQILWGYNKKNDR